MTELQNPYIYLLLLPEDKYLVFIKTGRMSWASESASST